ncbi:MAG: alpha-hydroxy-acid oxidizing protein [Acidimicrobiia bacterium]|nr:alpha-hydroxy-acid oxidizing protein [Acidimicrobiia bacterium]
MVVNIWDLRTQAKRRLPRVVFDYIDGAAEGEVSARDNIRVFDTVTFRPRHAVAVPSVDTSTQVLGHTIQFPVILAPVGSSRMFWPRGECVAAAEAGKAGTIYTLSTLSGCRLEDVKASTPGPAWYQVYLTGGRDVAKAAIARAKAAGFSALAVTIDTPVSGLRERDLRNGTIELLTRNPVKMLPYAGQFLARPRWLVDFFGDGGLMAFPNIELNGSPMPYADVSAALAATVVTWEDLRWIRDMWSGPVIVKGVLTAEDATRAVQQGCEGIVVSNHGARQLDGVSSTLRALPEVVEAVGGRCEVYLDGGVRRGTDVVKALCLGAKAVLIGRAYAYGLGAAGGPGVARAIDILRTDITRTLKLLGCRSVAELNRSYVDVPADWDRATHASPLHV